MGPVTSEVYRLIRSLETHVAVLGCIEDLGLAFLNRQP